MPVCDVLLKDDLWIEKSEEMSGQCHSGYDASFFDQQMRFALMRRIDTGCHTVVRISKVFMQCMDKMVVE